MFVDNRTVATVVLIEGDAAGRPAQQLRERGLALLDRRPAQVLPVGLELWGCGIAIEVGGNLLIGLRCAVILGQPAVFIAPADLSRIVVTDVSDTDYLAIVRRVADARFGRDDERFAAGFDGFPDSVVECYLGSFIGLQNLSETDVAANAEPDSVFSRL